MFTLSIKVCNTELNKNNLHMKTRILIMTLLVLLTGSTAFSQVSNNGAAQKASNTAQKDADDYKVYDIKEPKDTIGIEFPSFLGGDQAFNKFLAEYLGYPILAQENNIQGRVVVSAVLEKNGFLSCIKIEKSVHPSLDREALRVAKMMPRWKPAKKNGVPIRIKMHIPFNFRLQ